MSLITYNKDPFSSKIGELLAERRLACSSSLGKRRVAILGAGPAGLIRAIAALVNGNPVTVVEKRKEGEEGRLNGILLTPETTEVLKNYGVYQHLEATRKFGTSPDATRFPVSVALCDLEQAMKTVIGRLSDEPIILYGSRVHRIAERGRDEIDLILKTEGRNFACLPQIGLLFVTEGGKSETAANLLKCRRVEALAPIPATGAIYEDVFPDRQSFYSSDNSIGAASIVFTPGRCSIGYTPSKETSQLFPKFSQKTFNSFAERLFHKTEAKGQSPPNFDKTRYFANTSIASRFTLPACGQVGSSTVPFFLAGDALLEIDPTTGKGANNALESAANITPLLDAENPCEQLVEYQDQAEKNIEKSLRDTKCLRLWIGAQVDQRQFDFALFQLEKRPLAEAVQRIAGSLVGQRIAGALLSTRIGEKAFRLLSDAVDYAKQTRCLHRFLNRRNKEKSHVDQR